MTINHPRGHFMRLAIVAVLGLLVYSNTFSVPFVFDDQPNIIENASVRDLSNIPSMLAGRGEEWASRPLLHVTDALNFHMGGLDPRGYHVFNLALHLANAILLYLLVITTGRLAGRDEEMARGAAFLAALLFVAHPLQTEALTYVVSRSVLLVTFFFLSGILIFARAAMAERNRWLYAAGLLAVSILGAASREDFVTFPLILLLYDLCFVSGLSPKAAARNWRLYLPALLGMAYLAYLAMHHTYARPGHYYMGGGIPHLRYVLTEFNVNWTYLRMLALPVNQNLVPDYPTAKGLFEMPTLLAFAGYLGLWAAALAFIRKRPAAAFFALWFLVTLVPISFAVALMDLKLGTVLLEHRAYLPSVGIIAGVSLCGAALAGKAGRRTRRALAVFAAVAVLALSSATYARNAVWKDSVGLWEDVVSKSPRMANAHTNLGYEYFKSKQMEKAIEQYMIAIEIWPDDAYARRDLALAYWTKGLYADAIEQYRAAIELDPGYAAAHNGMGLALAALNRYDEAIVEYKAALGINPDFAEAHFNLGLVYISQGRKDLARDEFAAALRLEPGFAQARQFLDYTEGRGGGH